jgi:hypothetical protein
VNARGTSLYTSLAPLPSFCWGGALSLGHRRLRCIGTARGRAWSVGLSGVYTENGFCPCNRVLSCNDKLTAGAVDAARLLLARFDITPRTICVDDGVHVHYVRGESRGQEGARKRQSVRDAERWRVGANEVGRAPAHDELLSLTQRTFCRSARFSPVSVSCQPRALFEGVHARAVSSLVSLCFKTRM